MFRKTKRTKRVIDSKQCDQWKTRKIDRRCFTISQQMKMITLKKHDDTEREMKIKTSINQRNVDRIYRRVMNRLVTSMSIEISRYKTPLTLDRSMKFELLIIDFRCYEYKLTSHARAVTNEQIERIVEYVMSISKTRKMTALKLIKEMNLKDLKHDKYERELSLSKSCFKQIMYDSGYDREIAGWKTDLNDKHRQDRLLFAQKYRHFDWKRRDISSDEIKIKKVEHYNKKMWKVSDEKLSVNVINRSEQSHNKIMRQIFARIEYKYKFKLMFLWPETEEKKQKAAIDLKSKNENRVNWNALLFAINQEIRQQKETTADRKKSERKSQYEMFKRNQLFTRENRSNGGMNWYIYFNRVLKIDAFSELKRLQQQNRDSIMIEDNAGNHIACDEFWNIYKCHKFNDWSAKSLDLNPIEKAWTWCRQWLRNNDMMFHNRREIMAEWRAIWKTLFYRLINKWFKNMKSLLDKIIEHENNNDFQI